MNKEKLQLLRGKKGTTSNRCHFHLWPFLHYTGFPMQIYKDKVRWPRLPPLAVLEAMLSTSHSDKAGGRVRGPSVLELSVCPTTTALSQHSSVGNILEKWSAVGSTKQDLVQQIYYKQLLPSILQVICSLPSLTFMGNKPIFTGNS